MLACYPSGPNRTHRCRAAEILECHSAGRGPVLKEPNRRRVACERQDGPFAVGRATFMRFVPRFVAALQQSLRSCQSPCAAPWQFAWEFQPKPAPRPKIADTPTPKQKAALATLCHELAKKRQNFCKPFALAMQKRMSRGRSYDAKSAPSRAAVWPSLDKMTAAKPSHTRLTSQCGPTTPRPRGGRLAQW